MKHRNSPKASGKSSSKKSHKPREGRNIHGRSANSHRISVGHHAVNETLKVRPQEIVKLLLKEGWERSKELLDIAAKARRLKVPQEIVSTHVLDRLNHHHQGVACEIQGRPQIRIEDLGSSERSTVLVLDGVEDPHNLGAILRTAWLMGVAAIILPSERAVGLTSTVHKVSCGGVEHVPVIEVPQLAAALKTLKSQGFWVFGLAANGTAVIGKMKLPEKVIWVLGAEDKGLRVTTEKECDELVSIPQLDNAASYNVSVAAGITLYETLRETPK